MLGLALFVLAGFALFGPGDHGGGFVMLGIAAALAGTALIVHSRRPQESQEHSIHRGRNHWDANRASDYETLRRRPDMHSGGAAGSLIMDGGRRTTVTARRTITAGGGQRHVDRRVLVAA